MSMQAQAGNAPHQNVLILHPNDDVAIARCDLAAQQELHVERGDARSLHTRQPIPSGHKVALHAIATGQPVRRYGQVIGFATQPIAAGEHVHTHNLAATDFDREYAFGVDARPVQVLPPDQRRTFLGYRRPDGRVGTRNYVALISTVNCSAHLS